MFKDTKTTSMLIQIQKNIMKLFHKTFVFDNSICIRSGYSYWLSVPTLLKDLFNSVNCWSYKWSVFWSPSSIQSSYHNKLIFYLVIFLMRAKGSPSNNGRPKRKLNGRKRCKNQCVTCPFTKEAKFIQNKYFKWYLNRELNYRWYKKHCVDHRMLFRKLQLKIYLWNRVEILR